MNRQTKIALIILIIFAVGMTISVAVAEPVSAAELGSAAEKQSESKMSFLPDFF